MIWVADAGGQCIYANRRWLTFRGRGLELELGTGWIDGLHPDDREACLAFTAAALGSRIPFDAEYRWLSADHEYRLIRVSGAPVVAAAAGGFNGYVASAVDVTEQRCAAHALERASNHLRLVAANADEMIYRYRLLPEPGLEYLSPATKRITGRPADEFFANPRQFFDLIVDEDRPLVEAVLANPELRGPIIIRWRHDEGTIVWAELQRLPIRDAEGTIAAIECVLRDVTREKQLERERDAHSLPLKSLMAHMNDGVVVESDDGRVLLVNEAFCRLFQLDEPPEALTGCEVRRLTGRLGPAAERFEELRRQRRRAEPEALRLADGRVIEIVYSPMFVDKRLCTHVWQCRDISDRTQFEEELRVSRQRLRELVAHQESVREEERHGVARLLHDELGQLLTSIKLELGMLTALVRPSAGPSSSEVVDRLQSLAGLLGVSIATVQRVAAKVRPVTLDPLGLAEAVRSEALLFEARTRIRCRVSVSPAKLQIDPERANALYRILAEALTNVARHAAAGAVRISLKKDGGSVSLTVRDNGRGIAPDQIDNARTMGLLGMRERALALGGDVRITSNGKRGTVVVATLPLPTAPSSAGTSGTGAVSP